MMQNNVKIAITGGICSGKSTVAEIIKEQGYTVLSCDNIYRELLNDKKFVNLIAAEFGDVRKNDGTLDRKKLAEIVFCDEKKLQKLNLLTHPLIMKTALGRMNGGGIRFCEVPLLFEGDFCNLFDNVVVVLRDKTVRIKELMQRTGINENQALLRINSQFNYENYNFIRYYVIHNNGNLIDLRKKVLNALEKIQKDYV